MVDSDRKIIEAIRKGSVRRFGELVDRHKDRAMTLALRIVGEKWEAEELVQDAFLRAFRGLEGFREESRFSTWFYRILYNVCMTRVLRRPQEKMRVEVTDAELLDTEFPDTSVLSALERLENKETNAILHEEMQKLPDHFRITLTLFYVQDLSYEEIASVLQMPIGTIKTNLSRGRLLMRQRVVQRMKEEVHVA